MKQVEYDGVIYFRPTCPKCKSEMQPFIFWGPGRYNLTCSCRDSHHHCYHGAQMSWTDHLIRGCCICHGYPCSQTNEYFQSEDNRRSFFQSLKLEKSSSVVDSRKKTARKKERSRDLTIWEKFKTFLLPGWEKREY